MKIVNRTLEEADRGLLEAHTLPPEHLRAPVRHPRDELGDQPALADPRVATDHDDARPALPGARHGRHELTQLGGTSGEHRALDALRHAASIGFLGMSVGGNTELPDGGIGRPPDAAHHRGT